MAVLFDMNANACRIEALVESLIRRINCGDPVAWAQKKLVVSDQLVDLNDGRWLLQYTFSGKSPDTDLVVVIDEVGTRASKGEKLSTSTARLDMASVRGKLECSPVEALFELKTNGFHERIG